MTVDAKSLNAKVDQELEQLSDNRVVSHILALRSEPAITIRRWDYGREDEQYPCWTVLRHPASNTGIAYCERGFGPRSPWGLIILDGDEGDMSIGMDCSWYKRFLHAFFESWAATDLSIWRVFKTESAAGESHAISGEGDWDVTWSKVMALRESHPANRYDCRTSIDYERE
ncbi:MAG: hypothetical protein JO056_00235 [Alphaproteobacteria bacterium]|nr:hypothetical protein [Alphaproteobacteria bacterium]